jgi:hypothetical protein
MINMGYCRFENTYLALDECIDALTEKDTISASENNYRMLLLDKCKEYIEKCENYIPNIEEQTN